MPYEQYMGQASPASDLYALAATFLHLVTGRAPPEFLSSAGRLEVPDSLPCGEPLVSVLARMLAPAPADRFQSARAARSALMGGTGMAAGNAVASTAPTVPTARTRGPELPPAPRPLTGPTLARFKEVAYTGWQLLDSDARKSRPTIGDRAIVIFFSILTAGILPILIWGRARSRRNRLKPFFERGLPARATIQEMVRESAEFEVKLSRVRYEFEADGARHRGSDSVLPVLAERWETGEQIDVLYLPDQDYDSVIVSTR
jgi:hypothetical protein